MIDETKLIEFVRKEGDVISDFVPTLHFRIAVPEGTHFPQEEKLQQLWVAHTFRGPLKEDWRDIERVVVKK